MEISFCDCTNVCVLREEILGDYDKVPKGLTGIYFCSLTSFYATGNKR